MRQGLLIMVSDLPESPLDIVEPARAPIRVRQARIKFVREQELLPNVRIGYGDEPGPQAGGAPC